MSKDIKPQLMLSGDQWKRIREVNRVKSMLTTKYLAERMLEATQNYLQHIQKLDFDNTDFTIIHKPQAAYDKALKELINEGENTAILLSDVYLILRDKFE